MKTMNDMTSHVIDPQVAVAAAVLYGNLRNGEVLGFQSQPAEETLGA